MAPSGRACASAATTSMDRHRPARRRQRLQYGGGSASILFYSKKPTSTSLPLPRLTSGLHWLAGHLTGRTPPTTLPTPLMLASPPQPWIRPTTVPPTPPPRHQLRQCRRHHRRPSPPSTLPRLPHPLEPELALPSSFGLTSLPATAAPSPWRTLFAAATADSSTCAFAGLGTPSA